MLGSKEFIAPVLERTNQLLIIALLILTVLVIAGYCFVPISSPDFWWQLVEGQQILTNRRLNTAPLGAFGFPPFPFVNEYVFYEVVIALAHEAVGLAGLRVLFGIINLVPFVLVSAIWLKCGGEFRFSDWLALTLAVGLLLVRLRQRPEVVGNALFLVLGLITLLRGFPPHLTRFHGVSVGVILCLWSNVHSSFIVGLGIVGLSAIETIWRHRTESNLKALVFANFCLIAAAVFGVIMNPLGLARLVAPFSLQTNFWSIAITGEMWPLPLHWYWVIASVVGFGAYLWLSSRARQRPLWLLVLFFASAFLALVSQRHTNLLGCVMLLFLIFRITSDPDASPSQSHNPLTFAAHAVVFLGFVTLLSVLLFWLARQEKEQWRKGEWAISNQQYAPNALHALHLREPGGAPFLAGIMVNAYAQGKPEYQLRPLLDTGLSRFTDDAAQFFFYLENQPPALRLALNLLNTNYVVVNEQNAHWAAVLNGMPEWVPVFLSPNGILYQRYGAEGKNSAALKESLKKISQQLEEEKKSTVGGFYTMGLLPPEYTFNLLGKAERDWWREPNINFVLYWLSGIPVSDLKDAMARSRADNSPQLRLRMLLALRLGLLEEVKILSRSAKMSVHYLEDAAFQAEALLSSKEPCAGWNAITSIFPPRRWSVRLAEVVNRIERRCPDGSHESSVKSKMPELVWSKDLEHWTRQMSHELNQRILTERKPR